MIVLPLDEMDEVSAAGITFLEQNEKTDGFRGYSFTISMLLNTGA